MKKIYFTYGFLGVGKTTFAKKLAKEKNITRLGIDEIMIRIFGKELSEDHFMPYFNNIEKMLQDISLEILKHSDAIVLDIGLWSRKTRDDWRNFAITHDIEYEIFNITCPEQEALNRVLLRTSRQEEGEFYIDEEKYNFLKNLFDELDDDEAATIIDGMNI